MRFSFAIFAFAAGLALVQAAPAPASASEPKAANLQQRGDCSGGTFSGGERIVCQYCNVINTSSGSTYISYEDHRWMVDDCNQRNTGTCADHGAMRYCTKYKPGPCNNC
ncbi:hypothetical protein BX616_009155 [Lobosporangium transversale]|uniref:Uncharacterized protein n=1 Tax=Lobosporangium transversale TaxID=64571 RepID=A0A1Y2H309_9FUNG|nr:hypothetical protein BCR41DRAFT_391374 [Lobosporangium transversale]KAF9918362.1 hypothetical protein BX616_009155 [Lobosporangium transversale]ORZ28959.1 hypothetical protein BCR41DRAFT_391374 [Lobosporangium transversale]|eukprot:XP_021886632.1 hypothetical protein BCR41DRAFT_391374 [Lobosporangium transversale]